MAGDGMQLSRALASRYEAVCPLGSGGLGQLYRVRERVSGANLALRVTEFFDAAPILTALQSVVDLHDRLAAHGLPVVRVCASGGDSGRAWYAMEFVDGESLLTRIRSGQSLSPRDAVRVIGAAAECIAALHAQQVLHQDLGPRNLFLDRNGSVRILEVGIAPAIASAIHERPGALGTPRARAPEQLVADPDPRSDLYALGAALFYALTGRKAMPDGAPNLRLATRGAIRPPAFDDIAAELRPILARALAMRPDERFPSARAFREALLKSGMAA